MALGAFAIWNKEPVCGRDGKEESEEPVREVDEAYTVFHRI